MDKTTPSSSASTTSYDLILSTLPPEWNTTQPPDPATDFDLTTYVLAVFPFYTAGLAFNLLSIYSILIAKVYRQYLSHVLLAVICIGAVLHGHGLMFLILLRWTSNSATSEPCASSIYCRDAGALLMHTHALLAAIERILAYLRKQPNNLHRPGMQRAHLLLIAMSVVSIILAFTVPIFAFTHSFSFLGGACLPIDVAAHGKYLLWIYFGFGHPFVWSACLLLAVFLLRATTSSYSTLAPMNRIVLTLSVCSAINVVIRTLLDHVIGLHSEQISVDNSTLPRKLIKQMNLRDAISLLYVLVVGVLFFLFRPEIRQWLGESAQRFQAARKEVVSPQTLEIRGELDDRFAENDDGDLHFRADI